MDDSLTREPWERPLSNSPTFASLQRGNTLPIPPSSLQFDNTKPPATLQSPKLKSPSAESFPVSGILPNELLPPGKTGVIRNSEPFTDHQEKPLLEVVSKPRSKSPGVSGISEEQVKPKEPIILSTALNDLDNSFNGTPAILPLAGGSSMHHNSSPKIGAFVGTLKQSAGKVGDNMAHVFRGRTDKYKPQLNEDFDDESDKRHYYNPLAVGDSNYSLQDPAIDGDKHRAQLNSSDSTYIEMQRVNFSLKDSMNFKGDLSSPHVAPEYVSFSSSSSHHKPQQPPPQVASTLGRTSTASSRGRHCSYASTASSIRDAIPGCVISFHNISYVVKTKRFPWSKPEKRTVLTDVSGIMRPGMNAIMGPTGSGKSSLLDVMAGRKDPAYLQGTLLIDGYPQPSNFKCLIGYVVQDDIVMGTLTVKENLRFSAALRLPKEKFTDEQREQKVQDILEELGLLHVANSKIGTELIRGVSGGERKRTNIGIELITDPRVLFLDEPTTGLDAFTANSVIKTLKNLSRRGRTIIFSIHQPKYSIYKLFDSLTLVAKGELVYHGPAENYPLQYFRALNYVCEAHNNPPDFFLDILHGEVEQFSNSTIPEEDPFLDEDASIVNMPIDNPMDKSDVCDRLIKQWRDSTQCAQIMTEVNHIYHESNIVSGNEENVKTTGGITVSYHTSFINQMWYVCWRTALNLIRNPQASIVQLAVYLFFALSMGIVYLKIDKSTEAGIQNRSGLFFFSSLQMVFVNLSAIEIFIKERQIFIHETSSGFYRTSAYFLAKVFCDMLPIKALPVVLFMPITYWMVGLKPDGGAFLFFELTLLLTTIAACGVAFFVSATVSIFGIANILISITYVFMMVFGGYLINLLSMGKWLSWCQYLSIFRYSISALSVNEFTNIVFCPVTNISLACKSGEVYLTEQDIPFSSQWNRWSNILGLVLISLFFCTLCYIQLRRINRYK